MSTIIERLTEAARIYPMIEDQPYSLFVDSIAEINRLESQVSNLECKLWHAQGPVSDTDNPIVGFEKDFWK